MHRAVPRAAPALRGGAPKSLRRAAIRRNESRGGDCVAEVAAAGVLSAPAIGTVRNSISSDAAQRSHVVRASTFQEIPTLPGNDADRIRQPHGIIGGLHIEQHVGRRIRIA